MNAFHRRMPLFRLRLPNHLPHGPPHALGANMLRGKVHGADGKEAAEQRRQGAPRLVDEAVRRNRRDPEGHREPDEGLGETVNPRAPRQLPQRHDGKDVAEERLEGPGDEPHEVGLGGASDRLLRLPHVHIAGDPDAGWDEDKGEEDDEERCRANLLLYRYISTHCAVILLMPLCSLGLSTLRYGREPISWWEFYRRGPSG